MSSKDKKDIESNINESDASSQTDSQANNTSSQTESADSDIQRELEDLREQFAKEHELFLRTAAEYDNFRKRSANEKAAAYTNAKSDAVAILLPVIDNLERAVEAAKDDESDLKKGVEMTLQQLTSCFEKLGVECIEAQANTPFNPELHNAVMHIEDESFEQNVIVQCFQKGYRIGNHVIRHSMVQVAN